MARLACDAARQMTVRPLPARVPLAAAGRACNFAHTLLVEAVRSSPAPTALVTAALNMLRAMTALSARLADEDRARWSAVLGETQPPLSLHPLLPPDSCCCTAESHSSELLLRLAS